MKKKENKAKSSNKKGSSKYERNNFYKIWIRPRKY